MSLTIIYFGTLEAGPGQPVTNLIWNGLGRPAPPDFSRMLHGDLGDVQRHGMAMWHRLSHIRDAPPNVALVSLALIAVLIPERGQCTIGRKIAVGKSRWYHIVKESHSASTF
jgi:hypothetical protein